jgi:tetratricopeptide (TPR) repeat protein
MMSPLLSAGRLPRAIALIMRLPFGIANSLFAGPFAVDRGGHWPDRNPETKRDPAPAPARLARKRWHFLVALVLLGGIASFLVVRGVRRQRGAPPRSIPGEASATRAVKYVGDAVCARCHSEISRTYGRHPMGRSLAPVGGASAPIADRAGDRAQFEVDGLLYSVESRDGRVFHREARLDASGRTIAQNEAEVHEVVGSGRQAFSYLIERDGFLFESPITWYSKDRRWGLSPSYETRNQHFERPILPECVFCHANRVEPVTGVVNRYRTPIFQGHAIGCERCHGPGELHTRNPTGGADRDPTIVNPADLAPALRDAVCEQCHLIGPRRVARLGTRTEDYRPGLAFHRFWSVFVPAGDTRENRFASQPEQMRASRCYRASAGRLGCISCHDPHVLPAPEEKAAYFLGRCLECHALAGCKLPAKVRLERQGADDCVGCHMPRGESSNNPHVATTNHRIPRFANDLAEPSATDRMAAVSTTNLVHFHRDLMSPDENALTERDRGIALCRSGGSSQAALALRLLEIAVAARPDDIPALEAKGEVLGRLARPADGLAAYQLAVALEPARQTALEGAADLAGKAGRYREAIDYWQRAIAVNPWRADYRAELAAAEVAVRDWKAAAAACRDSLRLNPFALNVRRWLVQTYLHLGDREAARTELDILLRFDPPDRGELLRRFGPATMPR